MIMDSPKIGDRVHVCGGGRGHIVDIRYERGFPMFVITMMTGKTVTEARYRFDVIPEMYIRQPVQLSNQERHHPTDYLSAASMSRSTSTCRSTSMSTSTLTSRSIIPEGLNTAPSRSTSEERQSAASLLATAQLNTRTSEDRQQSTASTDVPSRTIPSKETSKRKRSAPWDGELWEEVSEDDDDDNELNEFGGKSQEEIAAFIKDQENKGTARKTSSNLKTLATWLKEKRGEDRELHKIPPKELNNHLCKFFMMNRKSYGEEYEPSTLRGMLSSFNRHLIHHNYPLSLIESMEFAQLNSVIKSKQVQLKKEGKGNKPRRAEGLSKEEVEQLYASGQLGTSDPEILLHTLWFNNTIHFGLRGVTEHHTMKWGDLQIKTDTCGDEYLCFTERATKTRTGTDLNNIRATEPKMWANKSNPIRCPVEAYKKYRSLRPAQYRNPDDPFYIATNTARDKSQKWYKSQPVGINKLSTFMKLMATAAGLTTTSEKRLTNHSARKYVVQKLSDAGVPGNEIMQISGHKNIQSLNTYSSLNNDRHKYISSIIGGKETSRPKQKDSSIVSSQVATRSEDTGAQFQTINVAAHDTLRGQVPLFSHIYGGTFTVHYHVHNTVERMRLCNRISDSDSESE